MHTRFKRRLLTLGQWPALFFSLAALNAAEPAGSAAASATVATTNVAEAKPQSDSAAAKFMNTCAGCHSLMGVKLTGPELSHVSAWPEDQLKLAIKKMEAKVGPLKDAEIALLAGLLRDLKVRARLKAEEARIQAQFMAKLDPPNAVLGRQLFLGQAPLLNKGLACVACHPVAGQGGNLGPDLTGVYAKLGETPLISAIEKASFKIMGPHYLNHPITKQEAVHLSKYFSTLDPKQAGQTTAATFLPYGAGGALAMMAGLILYYRRQRAAREPSLQPRRK